MPTSYPVLINEVIEEVMKRNPLSVLDIGVGFGKWGFLIREYTDVFRGRFFEKDWKVTIEGIEIFEDYINDHDHYKTIYDKIHIGNANEVIDTLDRTYEMIFAGDVIEHFEKSVALELIEKIKEKSTESVMLIIPFGGDWEQGTVYDNVAETHLSTWSEKDFPNAFQIITKPDWKGRPIGLVIYRK